MILGKVEFSEVDGRLVEANKPRLPQMEAVMMFKFISASLWGCLGPVYSPFIHLYCNPMSLLLL